MRKIGFILLFIVIASISFAQGFKAELPYEVIGGKMIVEVELNGIKKKALFDTGAAKNSITKSLMTELGLSVTATQEMTDVNNNKAEYSKTAIPEIKIPGSEMTFGGFEALVLEGNPFECYGVEMLIGSEIFDGRVILEIDHKVKIITISTADQMPKASLRAVRPFSQQGYMPIFQVDLDGTLVNTLFDTGYGGFFLLDEKKYTDNKDKFNTISKTLSIGAGGLAGKAESAISNRVAIERMSVCIAKFLGAVVETKVAPFSLIGVKMLDYGKVTIDYARKKIYFEPYEKEVICPKPLNSFSMTVKDKKLVICDVWSDDENGIANGDLVTHINGKATPEVDFCQSVTVGIPQLKEKDRAVITVETKNGKKKINYYNKK